MTHPRLQALAREWRQNRRLRLGALAILMILGVQAALAMSDRRHARIEEYARNEELLGRLQEASRESAWPQRAKAAEAALAAARKSIPPARTDGLAQAEMQAWLADFAAFAGLSEPIVRVEASLGVPGQQDMWQVLARLDAGVPDGRMPVLTRTLAAALPWIRTEQLDIQSGRDIRMTLVVRGYFRRSDGAEAETAKRPADLPAAAPVAADAAVTPVRSPLAPPERSTSPRASREQPVSSPERPRPTPRTRRAPRTAASSGAGQGQ